MRQLRHRLRHQVGHRGSALLFFAVLDIIYCYALLSPPDVRSDQLVFLAVILPLWVWAIIWGSVGVLCGVQAFRRCDQVAFTCAIALKVMWGSVALGGWIVGSVDRGWLSAAVWLGFAAFVWIIASWPEPPHGWKERSWTQPSG